MKYERGIIGPMFMAEGGTPQKKYQNESINSLKLMDASESDEDNELPQVVPLDLHLDNSAN